MKNSVMKFITLINGGIYQNWVTSIYLILLKLKLYLYIISINLVCFIIIYNQLTIRNLSANTETLHYIIIQYIPNNSTFFVTSTLPSNKSDILGIF